MPEVVSCDDCQLPAALRDPILTPLDSMPTLFDPKATSRNVGPDTMLKFARGSSLGTGLGDAGMRIFDIAPGSRFEK